MKLRNLVLWCTLPLLGACKSPTVEPVDYVNTTMGNISHMLVPTYPTIHLPNSMLRVQPERGDYTGDLLNGLPVIVTSHRGSSAFNLSVYQGTKPPQSPVIRYSYDNEVLTPYYYEVSLDEQEIDVKYALSNQSAIYDFDYTKSGEPAYLLLNSRHGELKAEGNHISGFQRLQNNTRAYIYLESETMPQAQYVLKHRELVSGENEVEGRDACIVWQFANGPQQLNVRYGVSFISVEQAKLNLQREIKNYDVAALAQTGRQVWNDALGKIDVKGAVDDDLAVFYTSLCGC